jgi:hypothetical protein
MVKEVTITLPSLPPTLGKTVIYFDSGDASNKKVHIKVPSDADGGYGNIPAAYTSDTSNNWANAFRGRGWDGTQYLDGYVSSSIILDIDYITP